MIFIALHTRMQPYTVGIHQMSLPFYLSLYYNGRLGNKSHDCIDIKKKSHNGGQVPSGVGLLSVS